MKTIKILAPLIGLASITSSIIPLASCNANSEHGEDKEEIVCIRPEVDSGLNTNALFYFRFKGDNKPKRLDRVTISGQASNYLAIDSMSNIDEDGYFTIKIVLLDSVQSTDWIHYKFNLEFLYNGKTFIVKDLVFQFNERGAHLPDNPQEEEPPKEAEEAAPADVTEIEVNHQAPVIQYGNVYHLSDHSSSFVSVQYRWYGMVPIDNTLYVSFYQSAEQGVLPEWLTFVDEDGQEQDNIAIEIDDENSFFTLNFKIKEGYDIEDGTTIQYEDYILFQWSELDSSDYWATPEAPLLFIGYDKSYEFGKPTAYVNQSHFDMPAEIGRILQFEIKVDLPYFEYLHPEVIGIQLETDINLTLCYYNEDLQEFDIPSEGPLAVVDSLPFSIDNEILTIPVAITIWDEYIVSYDDIFTFNISCYDQDGNIFSTMNPFSIRLIEVE